MLFTYLPIVVVLRECKVIRDEKTELIFNFADSI